MSKKINRIIAGSLSAMFVGQALILGDGSSYGILHAETIASAIEMSENAKKEKELAKEFEDAVKDLGNVDYFSTPEYGISAFRVARSDAPSFASELTVSGIVQKGVVSGLSASDSTPIYVRIFNGNWEEITSQEVGDGGSYSVTAGGSDVYHVKFECDGYLPFYLKDFGTGSYQIGSGESKDTVTLVPGDTTYNSDNGNQWSDDRIDGNDVEYVRSCKDAYQGDPGFNPSMDCDGDGIVDFDGEDWRIFYSFYENFEENTYYDFLRSFTL